MVEASETSDFRRSSGDRDQQPKALQLALRFALVLFCLLPSATAHASPGNLLSEFAYGSDATLADGIAVADFDDDGEVDVARATRSLADPGTVRVEVAYSSQQDAVFRVHSNDSIAISVADVDNDGDPDLLFGSALTGATAGVLLNDGAGDLAPGRLDVAPVRVKNRYSLAPATAHLRDRVQDVWCPAAPDLVGWQQFVVQPVPRFAGLRPIPCSPSASSLRSSVRFRGPPAS